MARGGQHVQRGGVPWTLVGDCHSMAMWRLRGSMGQGNGMGKMEHDVMNTASGFSLVAAMARRVDTVGL